MQSRMVTAVAKISAQRQAPRSVRTRVTSASCKPPTPACGSSNSTRFTAGNSETADEADDMKLSCQMIQLDAHAGIEAMAIPQIHWACWPSSERRREHSSTPQGTPCRLRRVGFAIIGPGCRQNCLPLEQRIVVRLLVVAPLFGFLQSLHRAGMDGHYPFFCLPVSREPCCAGRGILVDVIACNHGLGDGVDLVGGLGSVSHKDRIRIVAEFDWLFLGDAGAAGRDMPEEE